MGSTITDNHRCHLILEIKVMKVYEDQFMYLLYCTVINLVSQMLATEYHMKRIYPWVREYRFRDYIKGSIPLEELMIPPIEISDF